MIKLISISILSVFMCVSFLGNSQSFKKINYSNQEIDNSVASFIGPPQIQAKSFKVFQIDVESIKLELQGVAKENDLENGFQAQIQFPHPDGTFHVYNTVEYEMMEPALAAKFPNIKTFNAKSADGKETIKWDITDQGLHVMIMKDGASTIFIDPLVSGNKDYYIVYNKSDFITSKSKECGFNSEIEGLTNMKSPTSGIVKSFGTCELRTYRLALAATGEYSQFHGGTVALAQSAQVTTMNRVNGVFEKDMAIRMIIVGNNNLIIYTNAGSDPYTNGTPGTMINQNQTNVDGLIGSGNYDIGHVFGTNSGGLAGLGVVCSNGNKARGVTGSGAPIGDAFDIDYVAHEMGHQFGANHTQNNNCNRNNATAMEPGSASTIMGYAGICAPNVQNNSDDHFHGISLEEIGIEILSAGHTCEVLTPLSNSAPVLVATNGNITVPASTPFALTAIATDADGDPISYNWEQMNNNVSTQPPVATSAAGPNFRSNSSVPEPTRYFPNLIDLAAGGPFTWEVVPSVTRTMNFRVTIRDNSIGGGCNDHDDVTLTTDAGSGPFIVSYPSATGIVWAGATSETVTWDVANTNNAPVSCTSVDILLSIDGGATYPTVLASGVPNDGSQAVTVPNTATTTARVMVISSTGTFFDISNNNFTITTATFDYTLIATSSTVSICQPADATFDLQVGQIGGYTDPVTLSVSGVPAGATSSFTTNPVTPVGSSQLIISNTGSAAPGSYTLTITGVSTSGTKTLDVTLNIASGTPSALNQTAPANTATGVAVPTNFAWNTAIGSGVTYEIDIATDAGFTAIVDQATGLATNSFTSSTLGSSTTYYWRVRAVTGCGTSLWSTTFEFTTGSCFIVSSTDIPVAISATGTPTVTSTINVTTAGTINDLNVIDLIGTHTWINDLTVSLQSPLGTTVVLWDAICNNEDNFDVNFDDAAAPGALPCPPVGGGTYQPAGSLADFNGEDALGIWTLTISDAVNQDGGSLNGWSLELCLAAAPPCSNPTLPTLGGPATVCEGETTTLSIATGTLNDATNWVWYTGSCGGTQVGTGATLIQNPTVTTAYFVRGEGGCVTPGACASTTVSVQAIDVTVTNNGNSLVSTQSGAQYQWVDCDNGNATIPGATQQTFVPTPIIGNYAVVVTIGSCSETSNCELIDFTGINELNGGGVVIYPNPASDIVTIDWKGELTSIRLTDSKGKILRVIDFPAGESYQLEVAKFSTGIYYIQVESQYGSSVYNIVKQ
ncbi:MAG: M12 family metallo-peptidase [Crocinitomicaceae bacterium]